MKSFTDIAQSQMLAKFLSLGSADMHYVRKTRDCDGNVVNGKWSWPKYGNPNSEHANYIVQNFSSYEKLPCIPIPYPYNPTEPYVTYTSGGNTLEPKGPAKEEDVSCGTLS